MCMCVCVYVCVCVCVSICVCVSVWQRLKTFNPNFCACGKKWEKNKENLFLLLLHADGKKDDKIQIWRCCKNTKYHIINVGFWVRIIEWPWPCIMARINNLWDGSLDKRSLVPSCGQDCYRAQVPQHPIDSYRQRSYEYWVIINHSAL